MKRLEVLFFGTILLSLAIILITISFKITFLTKTNVITTSWMSLLITVIIPVYLFPKSKWTKWWTSYAKFNKKSILKDKF